MNMSVDIEMNEFSNETDVSDNEETISKLQEEDVKVRIQTLADIIKQTHENIK